MVGRLNIWESSIELFFKNPFGVGIGNFKSEFTILQSSQLKNTYNNKFLLADINDYAFNDLLQFTVEGGLWFILLFFIIPYKDYFNSNRHFKAFTLFVILLSSSSYILHTLPTLFIILITANIIMSSNAYSKHPFKFTSKVFYLLPLCVGFFWSSLGYLAYQIDRKNSVNYPKIDCVLNYYRFLDNKYMYDWGILELSQSNFLMSKNLLKKSGMEDYDIDTSLALAISYEKMGQIELAEKYFLKSNRILPRIFKPKYYLINFYLNRKDLGNAKIIANEILLTPVKVNSLEINSLKNLARRTISQH